MKNSINSTSVQLPHNRKFFCLAFGRFTALAGLLVVLLFGASLSASAVVLDNFDDNVKSGWTDTIAGGAIAESGQQFNITTAAGGGALTYSKKTSIGVANASGRTVELRVDVTAASPGAGDPNPLAILAWVPSGGSLLAQGYSVSVGANNVQIKKGATSLYSTSAPLQNTNIAIVLRMTSSGASVTLKAQVYMLGNGVSRLIFERTVVDGSGLVGAGNAALGVFNQASGAAVSASFDNLQVFDMIHGVVDDFNAPTLSGWTFGTLAATGTATNDAGTLHMAGSSGDGGSPYISRNSPVFTVTDGSKIEFQVDVVNNVIAADTHAALGYTPNPALLAALGSYHVASDSIDVYNGKVYNSWWHGTPAPLPVPPSNIRLLISMTGEGTSCRVDSRIEDLNVADVNDPNYVVYQFTFLDTAASDAGMAPVPDAYVVGPGAYLNSPAGRFVIMAFNGGTASGVDIYFDNAEYTQTSPGNTAPININFSPSDGGNFVPAASSVSFDVVDDANIPAANIVLTLNGVVYNSASPGVTVTGSTSSKHFALAGALVANTYYSGTVSSTDNLGATSVDAIVFDTFLTSNLTLECEEYNFSSGLFIDNPLLITEGTSDANAYNDQPGTADTDFHDNRNNIDGGPADHTFRFNDFVKTAHTGDNPRSKYVLAGGQPNGFNEQVVIEVENGDWLNYTKTYPSGTYNVYLRQATYGIPATQVTLDRVTGDRTLPNQTTVTLGSFLGKRTGFDQFRLVPLTDATGSQLMTLRFANAVDTLRLSDRITKEPDSEVGQNYMVFVPVADPGTLRPIVTMSSPAANIPVGPLSPPASPSATIANRDTTVNTGTIALSLNGVPTPATVTPTVGGADVTWSFFNLPVAQTITNTLIFQDSASVWITNTWTYSFASFLRASNSIPLGSLSVRGFDTRMVQTNGAVIDNTLSVGEQQLAIPPEIPYEVTATNIIQTLDWDESGTPNPVPGLDPGTYNNIAVEMFGYVELTAGAHRFHVQSDDSFELRSGQNLADRNAVVLGWRSNGTYNDRFDFMVEATGLYPVRCIWEQGGGSANFYMWSVNADASELLVNDPSNPTGGVKAFYPVVCVSSAAVTGPYTADTTAVYNSVTLSGGTVTIPTTGAARFYRIDGPRSTKITSVVRSGSNIVLNYQAQ